MAAFLKEYIHWIFYLFMFVMCFIWAYAGNGGSHTSKRLWVKYGMPIGFGAFACLLIYAGDCYATHSERQECRELPAKAEGKLINGKCYQLIEGPVYVRNNTEVYRLK
ncbi:hypothetical protein AH06_64 [Erwinia phage AH06]|nr:hypothetical protein AH06_64 [Erwinia phage AH06]